MARFDKYLEEKDEEKKKAKEEFSNISLLDRMLSASLFFKYSAIFGKYFFVISPIRNLSIRIVRKALAKLPYYEEGGEKEEAIASAITGFFYLTLILFLITFDKKNLMPSLLILTIGLFATISNFNIARKYLLLGEIGSIPITSKEVISFLSWIVLLMEAGMNLYTALDYYVLKEKNNLSLIFDIALKKVKSGERSIDKALGDLAIEINREDLREILTLILQSKQQGVPIKNTLNTYFERYQAEIQSIAEKKGSSANQKATFMLTAEVFLLMVYFMVAMLASFSTGGGFF